jgi:hypothetical protein
MHSEAGFPRENQIENFLPNNESEAYPRDSAFSGELSDVGSHSSRFFNSVGVEQNFTGESHPDATASIPSTAGPAGILAARSSYRNSKTHLFKGRLSMKTRTKTICCAAVLGMALVNVPGVQAKSKSKAAAQQANAAAQKQAVAEAAILDNPQSTSAQKQQACVALIGLGPNGAPAEPALDRMLKDPNPQMRGDAVATLMKIGPGAHAAEGDLQTLAKTDPNPQVRNLAGDAAIQVSKQKGKGLLGGLFNFGSKTPAAGTGTDQQSNSAGGALGAALSTAQGLPIGGNAGNVLNQVQQVNSALTGTTTQPDATANGAMPTVADGTPAGVAGGTPILPQVGDASATPGTMAPGMAYNPQAQSGTLPPGAVYAPQQPNNQIAYVPQNANGANTGVAYQPQPAVASGYPAANPLGQQPAGAPQYATQGQTQVVVVPQGGAYGNVQQAPPPQLINSAGQPVGIAPGAAPAYSNQQPGGFAQQQNGGFAQQQQPDGFAQQQPGGFNQPQAGAYGQQQPVAGSAETIIIVSNPQPGYGQTAGAPMDTTPQANPQLASYTQPLVPQPVTQALPQSAQAAGGNSDYPGLGGGGPAIRQLLVHQISVGDDRVRTNQAFTLLVPDQWYGQANTGWTDANPASPAEPQFSLVNQQNNAAIFTQPAMYYYWSTDPNFARTASSGQRHLGALEMAPPANCQDALARIAWPARHNVQGAQVTSFRTIKEYAGAYLGEMPRVQSLREVLDGGVIRVHYTQGATAYDEDLYGVLGVVTNTATGASNWVIDRMVDFKAPAGQLDAVEKQADFVFGSARPTQAWFGNYLKAQQYLVAKLNATDPNSIGQPQYVSDQMAAEPLNAQETALLQRYRAGFDRSLLAMDRQIGGSEYFRNADGTYLPLPSGYGFAFTDGNGNYLVANTTSPLFPNISGGQAHWQPMTPIVFK